MKQQTKSDSQNAKKSTDKKDQPNAKGTGAEISTNSSKEDKNKPKRLGESETEITDETTI